MGVVGLWGLLIGSFAILSASVSSESSPPEYSAADGETRALIFEVEHLNGKTARLKGKLDDLRVLVEEEKRLRAEEAEEAAALRRRLGDVEGRLTRVESAAKALESWKGRTEGRLGWTMGVPTENVSTALGVNASAWELGGKTAFNVSQVMGGWRFIEVFGKYGRPSINPCDDYSFNLRGSTVEMTRRWGKSGDKKKGMGDLTVDTQAPHQWTYGTLVWTWVKTDYANWAVVLWCHDKELSSCDRLRILSRERTLHPATREMLRTVAEQRGFPTAHGVLGDQTSC